jgi:hypothetical protein
MRYGLLLTLTAAALFAQQDELRRYCLPCHNDRLKTAGLTLSNVSFAEHSATGEKVLRRLKARQMPPLGMPRPSEAVYSSLTSRIETALDTAAARQPNAGKLPALRRLTRFEYQNAIRDLLALDVDVTPLLPADESAGGFDNITVASLSPTLLERYLAAARKISRLATGTVPPAVNGETVTLPPDLTQEQHFEGLPLGTRGGTSLKFNFPLDADYEIILRLARDRNEHVEGFYGGSAAEHDLDFLLDGERIQTFTARRPKPKEDFSVVDRDFRLRIPVKAGPHTLQAVFPKRPSDLLETERQPYNAHFNMDRHPRPQPALYSITINGPYSARGAGDTPSRREIFICGQPRDEACAQRIVANLARQAYRRNVTPAEVQSLLRFYREARKESSFDESIEMSLRAILVSPQFLFRIEKTSEPKVSNTELASRLSFFLWGSIPDAQLLHANLLSPAVLAAQTRRMLADPKAESFIQNFTGQWLQLRNLAGINPDMRLFTDFDDNLRQAFREETERFAAHIWRADRPITELLSANYTFLNERLARHYGVPNVYGSNFRRVDFPATARERGGLLRHGSLLTVTSYATRTSPVIRGKWVLDNFLGVPPPPPPPDVPALKESTQSSKPLTVRERLAEHRKNAVCAGCHQLMDPIGFAFENYDAIGRLRQHEDFQPIDTSGTMFNGTKFKTIDDLEQAILDRPELFATTFTEKLLTYALGRNVTPEDAPAIRKIVRQASTAANNHRLSAYVTALTASLPFTNRNGRLVSARLVAIDQQTIASGASRRP